LDRVHVYGFAPEIRASLPAPPGTRMQLIEPKGLFEKKIPGLAAGRVAP
jgi:hypothetical protein